MGSDSVAASAAFILVAAVAGWLVGALLPRLIVWLPHRIEQDWHAQCLQAVRSSIAEPIGSASMAPAPDIADPPVARHLVMLVTGVAFAVSAWRYGVTWQALAAIVCLISLIALAWIDARTCLLPDVLTLPLLWLGLLINVGDVFAPLSHAVIGAAGGYLLPWTVYHAHRVVTGKEGMGHGDFKLLAAAGAWVGFQALPFVIVGACVVGVIGGLVLRATGRARAGQMLPFGPYIVMAFTVALLQLPGA